MYIDGVAPSIIFLYKDIFDVFMGYVQNWTFGYNIYRCKLHHTNSTSAILSLDNVNMIPC